MSISYKLLAQAVLNQYLLPLDGVHGVTHWARVQENGLRLAEETGANMDIIRLFALFHDACRQNESRDPGHGLRGAQLAVAFRGTYFELDDASFELFYMACEWHTHGNVEADITVQTCWDADRLDLQRAGIIPLPERLCTSAARDPNMIAWACKRSRSGSIAGLVFTEWGITF